MSWRVIDKMTNRKYESTTGEPMKIISFSVPAKIVEVLDKIVLTGVYSSRAELIRSILTQNLLELLSLTKNFEILSSMDNSQLKLIV